MKKSYLLFILFFQWLNVFTQPTLHAKLIDGSINSPVAFASDGSGYNYICEQSGVIRILKDGRILDEPFLDLRNKLIKQMNLYSERGLLGLAFHPNYASNGRFFVYYSATSKQKGSNHKSVISEFKRSQNPMKANPFSEKIILEIEQPESNHNGGNLAFGPDGFLYIGSGDGGGANDEHGKKGNGQNLETLLGKMLRIDINAGNPYKIPADNPFVNKGGRDEIWAYGLRNPWKFSFDKLSGKLFCADVGQDTWEEIDIIEKGGNYGWKIMEGNHCFESWGNCNKTGLKLPIAEYNHSTGKCIIGGYIYRGEAGAFAGRYFFGDWTGKLFMLTPVSGNWVMQELKVKGINGRFTINSFGEDEKGNIYLLGQKGIGPDEPAFVYKLTPSMTE